MPVSTGSTNGSSYGSTNGSSYGSSRTRNRASGPEDLPDDVDGFARTIVYDRLAVSARSRADLEQALAKKHVPAEVATAVLDRFEEAGLIDDEDFARSWVQSRQRSKGLSSRVLAMELHRKGIDKEIADEVLAELDPETERQSAHLLVQRKLRSMSALDDSTKIRRLTGMLARKGYSPGVAFEVVRIELGAVAQALDSM